LNSYMIKQRSFTRRVLVLFRPFWKPFAIVVFFMIVMQVANTFAPYLFGKAVDAVTKKDTYHTALYLGISFGLAILYGIIIAWISDKIEIKKLGDHIQKAFSVHSIEKMFSFSIGQHINEHSGVKQSIVNKGQQALSNMMFTILYNILPVLVQIVVTLVTLTVIDWKIAGVAFVFLATYILINARANKRHFPVIKEMRRLEQNQSKLQSELYRNSTLVIAEGQEVKTANEFSNSYGDVVTFKDNGWLALIKEFYLNKFLIVGGQYVTLAYGVYLIFAGYHTVGIFVALFSWMSGVFGNLGFIMRMQRQLMFQKAEIAKYFELLDIETDVNPNNGGKTIPALQGKIEFKNVSFSYPYRFSTKEVEDESNAEHTSQQDEAVSNVSFTIEAGSKVGFVGVSGSGKSTIVNLMRRYYDPTAGDILIDDVSLKDLDLRWLRMQIGNVEQKIDLFDRSIKDNIFFGLPDGSVVDEEKLKKVVHDASLDDFIAKLKEHGLDTVIGEGGIKVSGGERQRIGIARALIKDPKILIFDEATSALDSINEKLIHEAINRSAEGRTTIMIAHRLSTVMDADVIFVVADGKIVDRGTHKELKTRCPEYQELIKNQIF
jgi:ABC-type multidrug transport system fused ATPase/permease subunit